MKRKHKKMHLTDILLPVAAVLLATIGMWLIFLLYCRMAGPLDLAWK